MVTTSSLLLTALKKSSQPEVSAAIQKALAAPHITDYQEMARKDIHKMKDVLQKLGSKIKGYLKNVPYSEPGAPFERERIQMLSNVLNAMGGACGLLGSGEDDHLVVGFLEDAIKQLEDTVYY